MEVIGDNFTSKKLPSFLCKICDFKCSRKGDWNRHVSTAKHVRLTAANAHGDAFYTHHKHICKNCDKIYESRNGLWKHHKICKQNSEIYYDSENDSTDESYETSDKQIIMMLIKDNAEFKSMMLEQQKCIMDIVKNGTHNTTNSHNNNNNKTFNLQVFLNETCKDAINLSDFINQLHVSISDLEETGTIGYAEGISRLFLNNLKEIDYTLRPIHCSDSKRETLYIKDDDQWTKDDEQKTHLTKAIKQVANKNMKQIREWQKLHPEYNDPDSKQNDKYMKIVLNSMSGSTKEESDKNYEKIARNIVKEVVIEK